VTGDRLFYLAESNDSMWGKCAGRRFLNLNVNLSVLVDRFNEIQVKTLGIGQLFEQ